MRILRVTTLVLTALTVGCLGGGDDPSAATTGDRRGTPAGEADGTSGTGAQTAPSQRPSIAATNAFYYYRDVEAAWRFYTDIIGLETVADFGFAKIMRVAGESYLTLVDESRGMHSADEPKSVTLAFVTDELEGWWEHLSDADVPMRSPFEPEPGRPHVGFVAIDPEGYLLEFERFEPHAENDRLLPALQAIEPLFPADAVTTTRPPELGVRATIFWLYFDDTAEANRFYTRVLAEGPIVDQGWAWAYRLSDTGFIGVVDGDRGLHQATADKAVTLSLFVDDVEAWARYVDSVDGFESRSGEIGDESGRVRTYVGYDPEGTTLEWDTFLDVEGNERLLTLLRQLGE